MNSGQSPETQLAEIYDELRRLAARKLAREKPGQTLQPTALVHEAWIKLQGRDQVRYNDPKHFYAAAAGAMRQILIDRARKRASAKHGGKFVHKHLETLDLATTTEDDTLLALNAALEELQTDDPFKGEIVNLRFFVGLSVPEAGKVLGISEATTKRHWRYARAFLIASIRDSVS